MRTAYLAAFGTAVTLVAVPALAQPKADAKAPAADATPAADAPKADAADAPKADGADAKKDAPRETVEPPHEEWDIKDVTEEPLKTYYFIGARYRGNIVPAFILDLFVEGGKTVYSNTVGIELDMRKDGFSLIPALSYTEYGTDDILFKQKNTSDIPGNYSMANSSLKAVYATADLLWSAKISKQVAFEYGAGFGVGVVFGSLVTNWVFQDGNGTLTDDKNRKWALCQTEGQGPGCNRSDHQNADVAKVGRYVEPSWFSGGSRPVFFPWIALPQIGLRVKPVKQFEGRLGLGFSLTGFWFGLSGNYGLEQRPHGK